MALQSRLTELRSLQNLATSEPEQPSYFKTRVDR